MIKPVDLSNFLANSPFWVASIMLQTKNPIKLVCGMTKRTSEIKNNGDIPDILYNNMRL